MRLAGGTYFWRCPCPAKHGSSRHSFQSVSWLKVFSPNKHRVTKQFFGAVPADRMPVVAAKGAEAELTPYGFATAPLREAPRVVYAMRAGPSAVVERLIEDARAAAARCDFALDGQTPLRHVAETWRRGQRERRPPEPTGQRPQLRLPSAMLKPWDAPVVAWLTAISLYVSHLRAGGVEYVQLATRPPQVTS